VCALFGVRAIAATGIVPVRPGQPPRHRSPGVRGVRRPMTPEYHESERRIRRSIHLLAVISLVVVALVWVWLFLRETYARYEADRTAASDEYLELQRSILRERVNGVTDFIRSYRVQAAERLRTAVHDRVTDAIGIATQVIAANEGRAAEPAIRSQVVEALRALSRDSLHLYVWIVTQGGEMVLYPPDPSREGTVAGSNGISRAIEIAWSEGSGFVSGPASPSAHAGDADPDQVSYVQDFGRWSWLIGASAPLEVFEHALQDELLDVIGTFRYDGNYIFIDAFDGYALLMNGARMEPPYYAWELESADGVKVLQEQLRVAQENPEGGFLSYDWFEASAGENRQYLSFVRTIDDWGWKVGTGMYLEIIEDEIARRREALWTRTWNSIRLGSVIVATILGFVVVSSVAVNRRISTVFAALRTSLEASQDRLLEMNATLERRVQEETRRRLDMHRLSITDPLTGLSNRRYFEHALGLEWRRAARSGKPLSLIMADVDRFKDYNDLLGHPAGDRALVEIASVLRDSIRRPGDVAARYGGEEFAIILPDTPQADAVRIAESIRRRVRDLAIPHPSSEAHPMVSLSIGVGAIRVEPGADPLEFVTIVDRALYAAKRAGGNRVEVAAIESVSDADTYTDPKDRRQGNA